MLKKSLDHLVRCANSDIGQTGSSTAVSCAPNDLLELAVETLIQGGVESVLDTVDGQLESLHPVAGAVLRNELEAVELGQPVVRVTDGLQVQAGVVHGVALLLRLLQPVGLVVVLLGYVHLQCAVCSVQCAVCSVQWAVELFNTDDDTTISRRLKNVGSFGHY